MKVGEVSKSGKKKHVIHGLSQEDRIVIKMKGLGRHKRILSAKNWPSVQLAVDAGAPVPDG